jgi:hypothetical protein
MDHQSDHSNWLQTHLDNMRQFPAKLDDGYYCVTLTATDEGRVVVGFQTQWVGWADDDHRIELREPSLVKARIAKLWQEMHQPCLFVHSHEELLVFLMLGGNGLIIPHIAESSQYFSPMLKPDQSVKQGYSGFINPSLAHPEAQRRVPTPKLRMEVLKRDARKCRICGRSPDANVDIELHVHHIRPWASGGITDPLNLVTLCYTCHKGLEPHFDTSLFDYVQPNEGSGLAATHRRSVKNYRKSFFDNFRDLT